MKLVFAWPSISGYMAACWRELAGRAGIELFVVGLRRARGKHSDFQAGVMDGVPHHLLDEQERESPGRIRELVAAESPDVLFLSGWQHRPYLPLAFGRGMPSRRVLMIDNPLRGDLRQWVGRLALRPYLARMEAVFVPGERSWQYGRWLGVPPDRLHRGTYGVDWEGLAPLWDRRAAAPDGWPRRFLFTGQYVPRKGLDLLVEAYARYRARVDDPWPLETCGAGPEASRLKGLAGVTDHGFVQPDELEGIRARAGAFVLPSRSDAWPLALVESAAAGLPVVCSDACGSAVELVRPFHNGRTVPTGSVGALADALVWVHRSHDRLPTMGRASRGLAEAYSAQRWADRIVAVVEEVRP